MVMRIGGLASGMDIDALVEKLIQAEKAPLNKLYQKKTTAEWQRDAYREVNTKLKTFDTYIADNLVLKTLNSKTASSSNTSLVSATATGQASGTLSIESVSQLATAARGIGNQITATGSSKVSSLFADSSSMPNKITLQSIDKQGKLIDPVEISITKDMTIDELVKSVNSSSAGVSAIFESGRLSITSKNTGEEMNGGDAIQADAAGNQVFAALGLGDGTGSLVTTKGENAIFQVNGIVTERASNTFSINGYNVTLNSTFNEQKMFNSTKKNLDDALTSLETKYSHAFAGTDTTSKYMEFANKLVDLVEERTNADKLARDNYANARNEMLENNNPTLSTNYNSLSTESKQFLSTLTDAQRTELSILDLTDSTAIDESQLTSSQKTFLKDLATNNIADLGKIDSFSNDDLTEIKENTVSNVYSSLSNDAISKLATLNYADIQDSTEISDDDKAIFATIGETGFNKIKEYDTNLPGLVSAISASSSALKEVKDDITFLNDKGNAYIDAGDKATNATSPTVSDVTLTSTTNVEDMITKIKDFVNTYNGLIKDLNDQTKQTKYRDYAPLTDEQKKEMSENEIKLWEEKAKSGLLRNDSLVRNGLSNMRSLIYQSNPGLEGSKYNTLFNIGITTSRSYNDGGTLEIDEDKLRKAIEEDPDAVERLFKNAEGKKDDVITYEENGVTKTKTVDTRGFLYKLRDSMKELEVSIESKAGRSTMTDQQYMLGKSIIDTDKRIDTWQAKLKMIEARYWKQFGAMESAINKANQQSAMFFSQQGQ